ncbi:Cysteine desulfurase IscS [bioreactor metagenome]|uniref:cysteine desulfurase n=1 Tax=bioreactor metagenome TaxID=1076179 RepID=A0A644Y5J0_9ZZZZ
MENDIYFDHAATTAVDPAVIAAMQPYFSQNYGNASSIYQLGQISKQAVETARAQIATLLAAAPAEIFFTASGTEADNWALKGVAWANRHKGKHLVVSAIEHHAVLHSVQALEQQGFSVSYLPVNSAGQVEVATLEKALRPDTILVSVMLANNETGTLQPIKELAALAHQQGALFHTDAVQALGNIPVSVTELGVDLLSASGHKFAGPKGTGFLYIKKGTPIQAFLDGGAQERALRASTENVPGIVGMAQALTLASKRLPEKAKHVAILREAAWQKILQILPSARINGSQEARLAGTLNVCLPGFSAETLLLSLDQKGIFVSSGSACSAGSLDPSHVLLALGLTAEEAQNSLRLSFGRENSLAEIQRFAEVLAEICQRMQAVRKKA